MTLEDIKARIPDYAKDLKLNLSSVLTPQGSPGLSESQIFATAVASAHASRSPAFVRWIEAAAADRLDAETLTAARSAAAIMAMNNVYYRFTHLVGDEEYRNLPARLRMNVLARPPGDKTDFELYSLAVSAINGCGMCMAAHQKVLRKAGLSREAVQSAARIAAVIHAVAAVLETAPEMSLTRSAAA
ncbi:MAG TPA: carboxymuconolactone decarboxylase family protein [Gammaproteobacteria bacterium]|nr:carboxymuconolactone decarboxylase family protein [Gammaproteobacteria bacterium]